MIGSLLAILEGRRASHLCLLRFASMVYITYNSNGSSLATTSIDIVLPRNNINQTFAKITKSTLELALHTVMQ